MSDWLDETIPTTAHWVFHTIGELKDAVRAAHDAHCPHKADAAKWRESQARHAEIKALKAKVRGVP